jgi:hypothetical protein
MDKNTSQFSTIYEVRSDAHQKSAWRNASTLAKSCGNWHDGDGWIVPTLWLMPLTESLFRQRQIFALMRCIE